MIVSRNFSKHSPASPFAPLWFQLPQRLGTGQLSLWSKSHRLHPHFTHLMSKRKFAGHSAEFFAVLDFSAHFTIHWHLPQPYSRRRLNAIGTRYNLYNPSKSVRRLVVALIEFEVLQMTRGSGSDLYCLNQGCCQPNSLNPHVKGLRLGSFESVDDCLKLFLWAEVD